VVAGLVRLHSHDQALDFFGRQTRMTNPYQSPAFDPKQFQDTPQPSPVSAGDYGWINQVRIFAVLNAVQGMLEIPLGCLLVFAACFVPTVMRLERERPNADAPPEEFVWIIAIGYAAVGSPLILSGIARIWAAWQNFHFRGRTLGIVSVSLGMCTLLSCYCSPTAIALLVYGLILFFQPSVRAAFALGSQGASADQILAAFVPYRPSPYTPPPW
jgi:hypothetical protein